MITSNGIFNFDEQKVYAPSTGTWADVTDWDTWTSYNTDPPDYLYWLTEPIDLGGIKQFCLTITTEANGLVDYYIYTSDTGAFAGEETETEILAGDTGIQAFSGRYVWVGVRVEKLEQPQEITGIEIRVTETKNTFSVGNLDTSTLSGTAAARTLVFSRNIGTLSNIQITPKQVTPYTPDFYVSNIATSTHVTPIIVDKTVPSISLVGIDGVARDAVVDIVVEYLPEMYMTGRNLRVR